MKQVSILLLTIFISISAFAQTYVPAYDKPSKIARFEFKKDTLVITNYEAIKFIKIAGKVYQVKTELVYVSVSEYPITAYRIETNPHIISLPYTPLPSFNNILVK